jgi:hypothetical protein
MGRSCDSSQSNCADTEFRRIKLIDGRKHMVEDDEIIDAFYAGRRSSLYPLAVNDVVLVKEGRKSGSLATVISVQSVAPAVRYLVEYGDGSDDIVPLASLELKEADPDRPGNNARDAT